VNELIWVQPYQDRYAEKRRTGGSVIVIEDLRWKRCDIKSVNLLANCFGAEEAHSAGCDEALLMQSDGTLLEGTHSSLFGVRQQAVLTAPLGNHLLPGITRQLLMRLAQQAGIPVEERLLRRADLSEIDELFLTGTTTEIMPVVRVDGQDIGAGRPGPITQRLQQAYRDVIAALA
jgi:D-alanine transaminase